MKSDELNAVEKAYSKRPASPLSYRIYSDKQVNGVEKMRDYIAPKYRVGDDYANKIDEGDSTLYCLCRKPYNENDPEVMFWCDGPCGKWVHPRCFGESTEEI